MHKKILVIFTLLLLVFSLSVSAAWLPNFAYRKNITINGSLTTQTDYQVPFLVYYGSGSDIGEDVYCDGKCKTDFGDIRFTKSDGTTELDYFIIKNIESSVAAVWVKVETVFTGDNLIYIYYGSSNSTTTSSGSNTFPYLFEDMNNYNIGDSPSSTHWETSGTDSSNTITIQEDPTNSSKKCIQINESGDSTITKLTAKFKNYRPNFLFHYRIFGGDYEWYLLPEEDGTSHVKVKRNSGTDLFEYHNGSSYVNFVPPVASLDSMWIRLQHKVVNNTYHHLDYANVTDATGGFSSSYTQGSNKYSIYPQSDVQNSLYICGVEQNNNRYIFAQNFVIPEPSHQSYGSEEEYQVQPNIVVYNPTDFGVDVQLGETVDFDVEVEDSNVNDIITYDWEIDSTTVSTDEDMSYTISEGHVGLSRNVTLTVYDNSVMNYSDTETWNLTIVSGRYTQYTTRDFSKIVIDGLGVAGASFVPFIDLIIIMLILVAIITVVYFYFKKQG